MAMSSMIIKTDVMDHDGCYYRVATKSVNGNDTNIAIACFRNDKDTVIDEIVANLSPSDCTAIADILDAMSIIVKDGDAAVQRHGDSDYFPLTIAMFELIICSRGPDDLNRRILFETGMRGSCRVIISTQHRDSDEDIASLGVNLMVAECRALANMLRAVTIVDA